MPRFDGVGARVPRRSAEGGVFGRVAAQKKRVEAAKAPVPFAGTYAAEPTALVTRDNYAERVEATLAQYINAPMTNKTLAELNRAARRMAQEASDAMNDYRFRWTAPTWSLTASTWGTTTNLTMPTWMINGTTTATTTGTWGIQYGDTYPPEAPAARARRLQDAEAARATMRANEERRARELHDLAQRENRIRRGRYGGVLILDGVRKRAEDLLMRHLTDEQKVELADHGFFHLTLHKQDGTQRRYRIDRGTHGNVKRVDETGRVVEALCIQPAGVPAEDAMLAQVLWLKTNEEIFRRKANITVYDRDRDNPASATTRTIYGADGLLHAEGIVDRDGRLIERNNALQATG